MADQLFSVRSGFYNSINGDRTYYAADMNRPYSRIVSDGVFATNEGDPSNDFKVASANDGLKVVVSAGEAIVGHRWFISDTATVITAEQNNGSATRIDSIILQVNKKTAVRDGFIVYRKGTTSPPNLSSDSEIIELRVANISIAPGAATISTIHSSWAGISRMDSISAK